MHFKFLSRPSINSLPMQRLGNEIEYSASDIHHWQTIQFQSEIDSPLLSCCRIRRSSSGYRDINALIISRHNSNLLAGRRLSCTSVIIGRRRARSDEFNWNRIWERCFHRLGKTRRQKTSSNRNAVTVNKFVLFRFIEIRRCSSWIAVTLLSPNPSYKRLCRSVQWRTVWFSRAGAP